MKTAPSMLPARYAAVDLSTQYPVADCISRHHWCVTTQGHQYLRRGRDVVCERVPVAEIEVRCMEKEADGTVRVLPRLGDTGRERVTVSEFAA
jgi:hypothetical protein